MSLEKRMMTHMRYDLHVFVLLFRKGILSAYFLKVINMETWQNTATGWMPRLLQTAS